MDESFTAYRPARDDDEDEDDDGFSVIESSPGESMETSIIRSVKRDPNAKGVVIPPSDDEEDDEDEGEQESMETSFMELMNLSSKPVSDAEDVSIVGMRRLGGRRVLVSDDESEEEDEKEGDVNKEEEEEEREPSREKIVMSNATRLSIFGVGNVDTDSDQSDFIKSDNEDGAEDSDSSVSLSDLAPNPYVDAPFVQPPVNIKTEKVSGVQHFQIDLTKVGDEDDLDSSRMSVHCVDRDESVIAVSSDEDVSMTPRTKTPMKRSSPRKSPEQTKMSNYVHKIDKTYPNAQVRYVSRQQYENEMRKLNELRDDFKKLKDLLPKMNIEKLHDGGAKLTNRYAQLEADVRKQAEIVANLVVDQETAPITKHSAPLSWEQLQEASKAVQPRMFGTQAMNTHIAQRTVTLQRLHALHSSLDTRPAEDTLAKPPKGLKTVLMNHQLHAVAWLSWRETQTPRGGILADDMGLGKTLTMISLILHCKENNLVDPDENRENEDDDDWNDKKNGKLPIGGTLVVCPASLLKQWCGEVDTHCRKFTLKVTTHHGIKRETKAQKLASYDMVVTTYNIVQRDLEKKGVLMRIKWKRVILDEAHIVRNHKSQTAQAVFGLVSYTRWCLTGTPVHNKDLDLFSLLKFLRCSPFDDIVLWKKWIDNKSTGGQERLATVMKTLMLRRTKVQLQEENNNLSLPVKTVNFIDVKLTREEMNVYQKVLVFSKTLFAQYLHQRAEKNNPTHQDYNVPRDKREEFFRMHKKMAALHGGNEIKTHEILVLLLRLRQICCHPGLIHAMLDDEQDESSSPERSLGHIDMLHEISKLNIEEEENEPNPATQFPAEDDRTTVSEAIKKAFHISNPIFDLNNRSSKISAVLQCLVDNVLCNEDDKAIVVSQWTSVLDIIAKFLKEMGFKYSTLNGKVPVVARQSIVDNLNSPRSDVRVLLLSLCAGGVGLNLVGANHLILVDLHWNPQLESQAQDRIYRVGQKKPVHVYKLVCQDTIESSIKQLQDRKLTLANNILTGVKMMHSSKLSIEDLKLMFNMQG